MSSSQKQRHPSNVKLKTVFWAEKTITSSSVKQENEDYFEAYAPPNVDDSQNEAAEVMRTIRINSDNWSCRTLELIQDLIKELLARKKSKDEKLRLENTGGSRGDGGGMSGGKGGGGGFLGEMFGAKNIDSLKMTMSVKFK